MKYRGKDIEILAERRFFGKTIADIKLLASGEVISVQMEDINKEDSVPPAAELRFKAIAAKIRSEMYHQLMLAPLESSIIPLPHQILAMEKVMSGQFIRFLMADEVGMGKTIEAGLVLKELKIRGVVKRTLVVVPKSAMLQWQQELKKHFNESFSIYDSDYINTLTRTFSRLQAENEINLFTQHNQIIVSMDALKPLEARQGWSKQKVEEYNRYRIESVLDADFDLLIIDECHKVGGSTPQVGRFQMADILSNAIPNVLLLSATPHRGKSDHFRRILQLLDADAFSGEGMPPIPELDPYVVRTEKRQAIDYEGNPLFNKRVTQKVEVKYNPLLHSKQEKLYADVTDYVVNGFNLAQQTKNTSYGFVMLLFQRMMSSSTQAILRAMEKRANRLAGEKKDVSPENIMNNLEDFGFEGQLEMDFEQKIFTLVEEAQANYDTELSILQRLIRQAKDCLDTETDAKVEYLMEKLTELKRAESNPDLKFLIFTEFTETQSMLKKILEERGGYICEAINGSMEFDPRMDALRNFKETAQILISTDAAGESLNMQFAHVVINYDMPWNPMVLEQRIGRVDRIGQTFEVLALNMMLGNSVDKRVYEVIETKLSQILAQLGIDKTADVLDSTLEADQVNRLYLTSLLNPAKFEKESSDWLEEIKKKLLEYKTTEGALPTLNSNEIKAEKVDAIKHSPLPTWLEKLVKSYLKAQAVPYQNLIDGMKFQFPGRKENIYTFNIRESVNNPIPEPVSLQHEIIQIILSEAVPFTSSTRIPLARFSSGNTNSGTWSLWHLEARNHFETRHLIQPLFFSDQDETFPAFAQEIWTKMAQEEDFIESIGLLEMDNSRDLIENVSEKAEAILLSKYQDLEQKVMTNTERIKYNKEKSFEFQERQMQRIGIDNIRLSRLQRLYSEKEKWQQDFHMARQIIPALNCLMIIKFSNG